MTDEKGKSGWQSEQYASVIQFQLKISDKPTTSITYMRSHSTFGSLRFTFRTAPSPPLKEKDIVESLANGTIPSLLLTGWIPQFALWETTAFPYRQDNYDYNAEEKLNLLIWVQVVFAQYVVNLNKSGKTMIKIQTVTSC